MIAANARRCSSLSSGVCPGAWPVSRPLGIERQHPVPNNLTANGPRLRCLAPRPALVDHSKRQKAPRLPGVVDRRANPRTCSAV